MTCQDRVDLMQRYLDHDLNEAEEQELHLHLQQCSECAELFERLRRLDNELAQLPIVTPAFSLVDAILPQLAELDRQSAALEETAAREPEAPAFVPPGGIPRTRRSFVSWKWVSGAAVAAAILGVFVLKDQDIMLTPSLGKKDMASNAGSAAKMSNASAETALKAGSLPDAKGANAQPKQSGAATNDSKSVNDQSTANAPKAEKAQPAAADGAKPNAATPEQTAPSSEPKQQQSEYQTPKDDDSGRVVMSSPAAGSNPSEPAVNQPRGIAAAPNGPSAKGFAAVTTTEASSPDGKLVAVVEQSKVFIRSAANGDTVYKSVYGWTESDIVSLVGWSEDLLLTYRVQHPGSADTVVIDVSKKTETKSSSEATETPKN